MGITQMIVGDIQTLSKSHVLIFCHCQQSPQYNEMVPNATKINRIIQQDPQATELVTFEIILCVSLW